MPRESKSPPGDGTAPRSGRFGPPDEPALRFAAIEEEPPVGDVYEEEEPGVVGVAWLWVKRLVLIAGLAVGGLVAVNTWQTWLPVVTQVGLVIFTKVDEYVHPERARARVGKDETQSERQAALQLASSHLPHLSPETVELVLSSNMWSVLDPPEVFSRAFAAAKRGSPALGPPEAEELRTLETALLAGLSPAERQRAREYDVARAQRATMPAEDREMLGLYARGARALPTPSRERLRALLGKAIAAGLASGGA